MGLFSRRRSPAAAERRLTDGDIAAAVWNTRNAGSTAGAYVDDKTSNRLMAVWRCKHLLADIVSGLPIDQYRQRADGSREAMPAGEWVASPSDVVEPEEWRYQLMLSLLSTGNAFEFVTKWDPSFRWPRRSEVLCPDDVVVERKRGALQFPTYKVNGELVDPNLIFHHRAFGPGPGSVMGMSPIEYARQTIGLGLAVRDYGASWYASGGHPTQLLRNTQNDIDEAQAKAAKRRYKEATSGDHLVVLGQQWEVSQLQVSPDDALFLNATNATGVDICGYFGVPPEFLGYGSAGGSVTYANREQRALDFLTWTVQWWVGRIERAISRRLPQPQFVKLNVDALLRADALTRWTIHDKAVRMGVHSPNEVRRFEDESAIPGGGDEYLWPPYSTSPDPAQNGQVP